MGGIRMFNPRLRDFKYTDFAGNIFEKSRKLLQQRPYYNYGFNTDPKSPAIYGTVVGLAVILIAAGLIHFCSKRRQRIHQEVALAHRPAAANGTATADLPADDGTDQEKPAVPNLERIYTSSSRNPNTGQLECGLCFESMGGDGNKSLAVPPCGHAYCYECLSKVAFQEGPRAARCPACRRVFKLQQIIKMEESDLKGKTIKEENSVDET